MTAKLVSKYLIKYVASSKGHLDQQYKNCRLTQSTNLNNNKHDNPLYEDVIPTPITKRTNLVFLTIKSSQDYSPTRKNPTDQTGRFPILSNKGNQYIMLMYDYDSNGILVHPVINFDNLTDHIYLWVIWIFSKSVFFSNMYKSCNFIHNSK